MDHAVAVEQFFTDIHKGAQIDGEPIFTFELAPKCYGLVVLPGVDKRYVLVMDVDSSRKGAPIRYALLRYAFDLCTPGGNPQQPVMVFSRNTGRVSRRVSSDKNIRWQEETMDEGLARLLESTSLYDFRLSMDKTRIFYHYRTAGGPQRSGYIQALHGHKK